MNQEMLNTCKFFLYAFRTDRFDQVGNGALAQSALTLVQV